MSGKLQEALKNLVQRKVDTFAAEVVSVDKNEGSCVVTNGEIEFTDVALSATVEHGGKRFYIFPKIGSFVLVSPIAEDIHRLYVEFFSEVESMEYSLDTGLFIRMNKDGITIEAINKPIQINSNNSSVRISENGVDITSDKGITLNGGFEALYNKVNGMPITDLSQIGCSKKVKLG